MWRCSFAWSDLPHDNAGLECAGRVMQRWVIRSCECLASCIFRQCANTWCSNFNFQGEKSCDMCSVVARLLCATSVSTCFKTYWSCLEASPHLYSKSGRQLNFRCFSIHAKVYPNISGPGRRSRYIWTYILIWIGKKLATHRVICTLYLLYAIYVIFLSSLTKPAAWYS